MVISLSDVDQCFSTVGPPGHLERAIRENLQMGCHGMRLGGNW